MNDSAMQPTQPTVMTITGDNYFGQWTQTRTACRAVVEREGQVLLSYETKTDQWMLPGGGLEDGETETACCVREVQEETGYVVEPLACFLQTDELYEDWKYVSRFFVCRVIGTSERRLTRRERTVGMEPRWVPFDDIKAIFARHGDFAAADEMRRGIYLREYIALCTYEKQFLR